MIEPVGPLSKTLQDANFGNKVEREAYAKQKAEEAAALQAQRDRERRNMIAKQAYLEGLRAGSAIAPVSDYDRFSALQEEPVMEQPVQPMGPQTIPGQSMPQQLAERAPMAPPVPPAFLRTPVPNQTQQNVPPMQPQVPQGMPQGMPQGNIMPPIQTGSAPQSPLAQYAMRLAMENQNYG